MNEFPKLAIFKTHPELHNAFRTGSLVRTWADSYPMLFDDDDIRIAQNQAQMGYHFYEWLAAILIYHSLGYLSLVEQYEFDSHKRKQAVLRRLAAPEVVAFITDRKRSGRVQCPDLLIYLPDYSDWYFCEVKGPGDNLRAEQEELFGKLVEISGRPVKIVVFEQPIGARRAG